MVSAHDQLAEVAYLTLLKELQSRSNTPAESPNVRAAENDIAAASRELFDAAGNDLGIVKTTIKMMSETKEASWLALNFAKVFVTIGIPFQGDDTNRSKSVSPNAFAKMLALNVSGVLEFNSKFHAQQPPTKGKKTIFKKIKLDENEHVNALKAVASWLRSCARSVARIQKQIDKHPYAEKPNSPLGRFAFATDRVDPKEVPFEINTPLEDQLLKALRAHFDLNKNMSDEQADVFKSMLKKGKYKDVIHEPSSDKLYRGMSVSKAWLKKLLKTPSIKRNGTLEKRFLFRPKHGSASSWTNSSKVAWNFTSNSYLSSGKEGQVSVVLVAKVSDNPNKFVEGPNGLYKLAVAYDVKSEQESIGFGTIKVSEIQWRLDD